MSLDWYPGIRECCSHWKEAAMLQQTFDALDRAFNEGNDACIDCAKSMVEAVCRVIIDELDSPLAPIKPTEENPAFGSWMSAAVRVLKLSDNRDNAFRALVSQHHKLTTQLGILRNGAGPVSHGKDAFLSRLSAYHRRAAVLSADAIVAFLHQAYLEAELDLGRTREPYERFQPFHDLIDEHVSLTAEVDDDGLLQCAVRLPDGDELPLTVEPSRLLYQIDRSAYVTALQASRDAAAQAPGEAA